MHGPMDGLVAWALLWFGRGCAGQWVALTTLSWFGHGYTTLVNGWLGSMDMARCRPERQRKRGKMEPGSSSSGSSSSSSSSSRITALPFRSHQQPWNPTNSYHMHIQTHACIQMLLSGHLQTACEVCCKENRWLLSLQLDSG